MQYFIYFFVLSLCNVVCLPYSQHIFVETGPISRAQKSQIAHGYFIRADRGTEEKAHGAGREREKRRVVGAGVVPFPRAVHGEGCRPCEGS